MCIYISIYLYIYIYNFIPPWAGPGPGPAPCAGAAGPSVRGAGGTSVRGAPQRQPSISSRIFPGNLVCSLGEIRIL